MNARIFGLSVSPRRHDIKAPFVDVEVTGYEWGHAQYKKFFGAHNILGYPDLRLVKSEMIIPRCDGDDESFPKSSMMYEEHVNMTYTNMVNYIEDFLQGWTDAASTQQSRHLAVTTLRALEDLQINHDIDVCAIEFPHPGTLTPEQIDIVASSEILNGLFPREDETVSVSIEEREVVVFIDNKRTYRFTPFEFNDKEVEMIHWLLDVLTTNFARVVEEIMWKEFRAVAVDTLIKSIQASATDGGFTTVSNPYLK